MGAADKKEVNGELVCPEELKWMDKTNVNHQWVCDQAKEDGKKPFSFFGFHSYLFNNFLIKGLRFFGEIFTTFLEMVSF